MSETSIIRETDARRASEAWDIKKAIRQLFEHVGDDGMREGLEDTPDRFLKAMQFYCSGYAQNPADVFKTFEDGAEKYDEMVVLRNISIFSTCEHHLAPFFGVAHVAYIPDKRVIGLSKLPRLIEIFARRLQVQERLTREIADSIETHLQPLGAGVVLQCRHLCMECRGVQKSNVETTTSALRGAIKDKPAARAEFLSFISNAH